MPNDAVIEKKSDANKVLNVVGGEPPACAMATCQPCHRMDLQLLVVTQSVVHKRHAKALLDAGYLWDERFDNTFRDVPRDATMPVARLARPGFLYVFYEDRQRWDVWQVMDKSLNRKIMHQVDADQYRKLLPSFIQAKDPKACSQGAKNVQGQLICIEGAATVAHAWLAYAPHLWAHTVLRRYADNPTIKTPGPDGKLAEHKLRELRGRVISPKALMDPTAVAPGCVPLDKAMLATRIVDLVDKSSVSYSDSFAYSLNPLDEARVGMAQAFADRVRAIERTSGPAAKPGLYVNSSRIVMLSDDIGAIEEYNHLRLIAKEAREAWLTGGPDQDGNNGDPLRPWKILSSSHEEMIESSVFAEDYKMRQQYASYGAYQKTITTYEYEIIRRNEIATGKQYAAPGTQYVQVSPNWVRVVPPKAVLDKQLEQMAHEATKKRIQRYRGKVRMQGADGLLKFRDDFKAGVASWERYVAALDADFVAWLKHPRLAMTMRHDFDHAINLVKLDGDQVVVTQQIADVMARLDAIDKAWGGGAIGPASIRELAKAYGKDPDAPATWINKAMLEPFDLAKTIAEDPGKHKDVAERVNALGREMPKLVREGLHAAHEIHQQRLESVALAAQQAALLVGSLVDAEHARAMGLTQVSISEAERVLKIQCRASEIFSLVTDPGAEAHVTFKVKLETGEVLDRMTDAVRRKALQEALSQQQVQFEMDTKSNTTRQTRRTASNDLKRLAGRKGLDVPEFHSVIVSEKVLSQLEREAAKTGEELVEVVADDTLGKTLPRAFKLPKSTALNLIGEQMGAARATMRAVWSAQGGVAIVLGIFQVRSLLDALDKLEKVDGYAYTDALMSVFTGMTGVTEGGLNIVSGYFALRASGGKLVLGSTMTRAAVVRLAAGVAGVAGGVFDAVASYAKYQSAKNRGSAEAAAQFLRSASAFGWSAAGFAVGTGLGFANATVARFAVSRALVTRLGGAAVAELIGVSATGIGVVLMIAGFAWALYAESLEDDVVEIFLKRTYWGLGESAAVKFGAAAKPLAKKSDRGRLPPVGDDDINALLAWAQAGVNEERNGFGALSAGLKFSVEWIDHWFSESVLAVRLEGAAQGEVDVKANFDLEVLNASLGVISGYSGRDAPLTVDEESRHYVLEIKLPLGSSVWNSAKGARFKYSLFDTGERAWIATDMLMVEKK